jgi:imidazolonepropionase-like amidohydrolase
MGTTLIENGTLIDGTGAEARPLGGLLLDGDEIVALGEGASNAASGNDVERLDATGCTVMPGLIDAHCHVTFAEPQSNDELFFHRREGLAALVAGHNVQKLLRAGVTGFLDADVLFNLGVDLRDAIDAGVVEGPRMATGGNALLTAVGGTAGLLIPNEGNRGYAQIVNNRDEMITATRRQIKAGVDWVKIHATGLIPRQKARGEIQVWTLEELRSVCDTAGALGIPVVAHCRNASSTRDAARAGVSLILHATHMDDEALDAVVESGAALVPTLTFQANLVDFGHKVTRSAGQQCG